MTNHLMEEKKLEERYFLKNTRVCRFRQRLQVKISALSPTDRRQLVAELSLKSRYDRC